MIIHITTTITYCSCSVHKLSHKKNSSTDIKSYAVILRKGTNKTKQISTKLKCIFVNILENTVVYTFK